MDLDYTFLEEKKVDLRDLIAWLVLNWKKVICAALIGCVVLGLFFIIKTEIKANVDTGQKIEVTSAALSEAETLEVENTFHEYQIYQKYLKDLGGFSAVFLNQEKNDGIIMIAEYDIVSRLKDCSSIYTDIALTSEDYHTIYGIAYPEDQDMEDTAAKRDAPVQFISEGDGKTDTISLTAFIKADTEEQCNEILHVINAAFKKETKRLKETDRDISCRCVETGYSSEQNNFYDNAEKKVVERLGEVNRSLAILKNDHIDKFSDDQKYYFDVLKAGQKSVDPEESDAESADAADTADDAKDPGVSFSIKDFLKYLLGGLIAGFVVAVNVLIWMYVAYGTVNSERELGRFGFQTLGTLYFPKGNRKKYQIARIIRRITLTAVDTELQTLAESVSVMMKNLGAEKLYLLRTANDAKALEAAGKIRDLMAENDLEVVIGNPLKSREELKQLSDADRVIILASMKKTNKDTIKRVARLCGRCSKEILGFIAIEEC